MIIPVRCFTCGKVIGSIFEDYRRRLEMERGKLGEDAFKEKMKSGELTKPILDSLGVSRYCCRRMILSHADLIDDVMPYS